MTNCEVAASTVRHYVAGRKKELGLSGGEIFIPQSYNWGVEAQVDWYEAYAQFGDGLEKVEVFSMRSMASGAGFHRAYPRATQQAFFEGHEMAFQYFGGVARTLRYDNLASAVKKVLRGHTREENTRFIAFRSHWKFCAEFCNPQKGNEKGGVEGEAGYFRRNYLVPVPQARDFADLNEQLLTACRTEQTRMIGERQQCVGEGMIIEREHLLPLATEGFDLAEISFPIVDGKGRVKVRNNWYSAPARAGIKVMARILPTYIEIWQAGKLIARHQRCYLSGRQILDLEHYLDVLVYKPGALAGSKPLEQWREAGRWPASFDKIWEQLAKREGKQAGTRQMIELLIAGRQHGYERLKEAVECALELGCNDAAAILYLMRADQLVHCPAARIEITQLAQYERPLPIINDYDQLLCEEVAQ